MGGVELNLRFPDFLGKNEKIQLGSAGRFWQITFRCLWLCRQIRNRAKPKQRQYTPYLIQKSGDIAFKPLSKNAAGEGDQGTVSCCDQRRDVLIVSHIKFHGTEHLDRLKPCVVVYHLADPVVGGFPPAFYQDIDAGGFLTCVDKRSIFGIWIIFASSSKVCGTLAKRDCRSCFFCEESVLLSAFKLIIAPLYSLSFVPIGH